MGIRDSPLHWQSLSTREKVTILGGILLFILIMLLATTGGSLAGQYDLIPVL
jgi:hypothetical protein